MLASGAKRERCYFVQGARIDGQVQSFDPARDLAALERQIEAIGDVKLLIVDPIVSAVTGDSHKNTEVRRSLQPIVDFARRVDPAVLGITHFSKGGAGGDPAGRVVGSIAFAAVARVVLVAAKTKNAEGEDRRILARAKSNIGPDEGGFEYQIEQAELLPGISASYVVWGQAVAGTARDLLAESNEDSADAGGVSDAVAMLRAELSSEAWTPSETASKPLSEAGFTKKQIWAASTKLGVLRQKGGMHAGWYWRLPAIGSPQSGQ